MTSLHGPTTAVLVMDMQRPFLAHCADADGLTNGINAVTSAARSAGALVAFVRVGFRPGHPEMAARSPLAALAALVGDDGLVVGGADTDIDPRLHRKHSDVLVTKHRTSAMYGNDLELILRSRGVETLVLTGFSTGGVVVSTIDAAFDLDYGLVVPTDCCADPDTDLHETLVAKLFPRKATVLTSADIRWTGR